MSKLKGKKILKEMNDLINELVSPFGVKAKLGTDFCYLHEKKTVYYCFAVPDRFRETWNRWVRSRCPYVNCDLFLTSLMHEVGHHMTIDTITPEIQRFCDEMKEEIEKWATDDSHISSTELDFMYYGLYDELAATDWGLNYIANAPKVCREFWKKFQPLLLKFYEVNNVDYGEEVQGYVRINTSLKAKTYEEVFDCEGVEYSVEDSGEETEDKRAEQKFSDEIGGNEEC